MDSSNAYKISLVDLQKVDDDTLESLLRCSDEDRLRGNYRAECTYYMCKMEKSRRDATKSPDMMTVKATVNLYDYDGKLIFEYGERYEMFFIDGAIIVYTELWVPHIFSMERNNDKRVWKYFGMCSDKKNLHTS